MTHHKVTAIGSRLALGRGVSNGIALLRPKLASLHAAHGHNAATHAVLARLGKELSRLMPSAAPISASAVRTAAPIQLSASDFAISGPRNRAAHRHDPPRAATQSGGEFPPTVPQVDSTTRFTSLVPPRTDRPSRSGAAAPSTTPKAAARIATNAPGVALNTPRPATPDAAQVRTTVADPGLPAAPPQISSAVEMPAFAPVADVGSSVPTSAAISDFATPERTAASSPSPTSVARSGPLPDWLQQTQGEPLPGAAPVSSPLPAAPIRLPTPQDDQSPAGNLANSLASLSPMRGFPAQIAGAATPVADANQPGSTQASSGQQQGTLSLDSVQLGRWMIDHMERQASRPGTMTTGIDPRMTTIFPGAPTGA